MNTAALTRSEALNALTKEMAPSKPLLHTASTDNDQAGFYEAVNTDRGERGKEVRGCFTELPI